MRKGIVLFCDAVELLSAGAAPLLPAGTRVTFLGSDRNTVGALNGGDYARQRASRCGRLCPPMSTYVSRSWAATAHG